MRCQPSTLNYCHSEDVRLLVIFYGIIASLQRIREYSRRIGIRKEAVCVSLNIHPDRLIEVTTKLSQLNRTNIRYSYLNAPRARTALTAVL